MAWLQSHQELRSHPKTRKAARKADCSVPQMIGHLHLLWWWSMDHAPDGDLSRFDADDIADAAGYEGDDPEEFIAALVDCGPADGPGFLEQGWQLHDWEEYGGKYAKRVHAARKAAEARWHPDRDASEDDSDSQSNATALPTHSDGNAEERRGEEKRVETQENTTSDLRPDTTTPDVSEQARQLTRQFAEAVRANGHPVPQRGSSSNTAWLVEMDRLLRIGPPGWDGDPPTAEEVAHVIDWTCTDDFEAANVQAVPKFRKRYSQLRLKAVNSSKPRASATSRGVDYADRYQQAAAELERQGR